MTMPSASELERIEQERQAAAGHNHVAADQLRLFVERVERLNEEKKGIADDIKDVFAEAKANGYDTKTMREVIRQRKMEKHAREEQRALVDTYLAALGML
jgi:uncharacterized protein (UPF0335 family)